MKIPNLMQWILAFFLVAGTLPVARADDSPSRREPVASETYTPGSQRLSLELGAGIPTSVNSYSESEKMGPMGGLQYLYTVDEFWGVGVQADYFQFAAKEHAITSDTGGLVNARSKDNVATLEVMARYTFLPNARFVPYLHSGLGLTYFRQTAEGEPLAGSTWTDTGTTETRSLQDVSSVNFSYSVGVGVETNLTKNLLLGLETAWHIFGVSKVTYGTNTIDVPTVSLRLGWHFGPKPPPAS